MNQRYFDWLNRKEERSKKLKQERELAIRKIEAEGRVIANSLRKLRQNEAYRPVWAHFGKLLDYLGTELELANAADTAMHGGSSALAVVCGYSDSRFGVRKH